jgi:transposase
MTMFAGLDVGGKTTAICIVDGAGKTVWQGMADTHPDGIAARLKGFQDKLVKVGVESGPFTPHLHRALTALGFPMVCLDARRAADAIKSRRIKSDKADASRGNARLWRDGLGRNAPDGLVHRGAREVRRKP